MQSFEQAFDLYAKHDYPAAEKAFKAGIDKGDAQPEFLGLGHYYLAEALMAQHRPSQDALAHYKEAARLIPQRPEGLEAQAKIQRLGLLDDCDRLAADLEDPDRPDNFPGVAAAAMDGPAAVKACAAAAKAFPDNRRILYELGRAHQASKDIAESRKWFQQAAAAGSMRGMYFLGVLHEQEPSLKDFVAARQWYDKAVAVGSVDAMRRLAVLTEKGMGGPPDGAGARKLYEKAADKGDSMAMLLLGAMHHYGKGGPVSYPEARRWYRKAADIGDPGAMYFLAMTYDDGGDGRSNYVEARNWYEKAAAGGSVSSMVRLGDLHAAGLGVPRNSALAKKWYQQAATAGSATAQKRLDALEGGAPKRRSR
jgi:TPR repeat protein